MTTCPGRSLGVREDKPDSAGRVERRDTRHQQLSAACWLAIINRKGNTLPLEFAAMSRYLPTPIRPKSLCANTGSIAII
jgi:hypothetical protein